MTIGDQITEACANLGRRKVRMVLASLGVVVGTVTIVLLVSLASGVSRQINHQFETIGLDKLTVIPGGGWPGFDPGGTAKRSKLITQTEVSRWAKWPGVAKVAPQISLPMSANVEVRWKGKSQAVQTGRGMQGPGGRQGMWSGDAVALAGTLDLPDKGGLVLSEGTVQALGLGSNDWARALGEPIEAVLRTSRGETQSFAFHITGISSEKNRTIQGAAADWLAMKTWWFNATNLLQQEGYDSVTIRATDVTQAKALMPRLKQEGYQVMSLEMFMEVANRIVVAITAVLGLIASIALLVASLGIANTMVMAVYERTREIGILKALGASGGEIRRLFMIEAGLIGLSGGVIGLGLGWVIGVVLNQGILWYMRYRDLPVQGSFFALPAWLAVVAILFAAGLGMLAGLLPAHRAAKLDPLTALRHE